MTVRRSRRAPVPPAAQAAELVRARLLERLGERFAVPVTVVIAGAGFGKSVLLAQAYRANQVAPRGIDAWVSCEPGDGDARHLAAAIIDALGGAEVRPTDPVARVIGALNHLSPIDVSVIIDDLHEVPPSSSGATLLSEVLERLPPHVHLVLAGRTEPPMPLDDRRAAGAVVELGVEELAFTATEVATLGRLLDAPRERLVDLDQVAGWPSLVRLALSAPAPARLQYLWEEVISGLEPELQTALLALGTLGWGTTADAAEVAGAPVDLDALSATVPLVRADAGGWYSAHQLWETAIDRIFPETARRGPRQRALALFRRRGDTQRAGWSAIDWGDDAALRTAACHLVRDTYGALPIDTAERWIAAAPAEVRATPELQLLKLAVIHARRYDDPRLAEIDALVDRFSVDSDAEAAAVALAFATVVAHSLGDEARLVAIDKRARSLHRARTEPILRFLHGAVAAGLASLVGDLDGALAALATLSFAGVPPSVAELVIRMHNAVLCLAGRADDAVAVSAPLADSASSYVRTIPKHTRWLAGDVDAFSAGELRADPGPETNERYHFYHAVYSTPVAASFGEIAVVEQLRPTIEKFAAGTLDSRDRAMVALTTAIRCVARHDEAAAARTVADHLDQHPVTDRLADIHLRRVLPIAYVLDGRARRHWSAAQLGPAHERHRQVADLLLAARAGELSADFALPSVAEVATALPLAWSTELAVRAQCAGCVAGRSLVTGLAAVAPRALRAELEHLIDHEESAVAATARKLCATLPDPNRPPIDVNVLGELEIIDAGVAIRGEGVRRRVRTLLELLVIGGHWRRDRLATVMWPGLDPVAAGRNLRVTLSRLRDVLATRRDALLLDGDVVALASPPVVDADLWMFRRDVAVADGAERSGDLGGTVAALERACDRWRGDPFPDLEDVGEMAGDVAAINEQLVASTLRLGELLLVAGRFDDAAARAERVRQASVYDERGHRLVIAAHLQRGDRDAAVDAVAATETMLAELGVDPEPETEMLLRQTQARFGHR